MSGNSHLFYLFGIWTTTVTVFEQLQLHWTHLSIGSKISHFLLVWDLINHPKNFVVSHFIKSLSLFKSAAMTYEQTEPFKYFMCCGVHCKGFSKVWFKLFVYASHLLFMLDYYKRKYAAHIYIYILIAFHVADKFTFTAPADRCDWPKGVCTYIDDPCPPDIPYDCHTDYYCQLPTNKCCCR